MDNDVIVIGGGLSGLAAAATAARAGARVTLLEAQSQLGGRARTDRIDGFGLLRGPHALYGGGPADRVLGALGVAPAGRTPAVRDHRLLRGGALERPPYDVMRPRPGVALKAFAWVLRARPEEHEGSSAADWLASFRGSDRARGLLTALVRTATYTSALDELPAALAIEQTRRAARPGVSYLDGGWQPMVEALATAARAAGATVRPRAKVEALLAGGAGVALADGEELRAATVVVAGLGPDGAGRLLSRAGGTAPVSARRPIEAACLDVALRRLPRGDRRFVMGVDAPLLLTEVTRAARDCAPAGGAVVHVAKYLRDGEDQGSREELEQLLELAQPGWREQVVHARYLPRMTVVEHLGPRPAIDATGLPGVLFAGDWVGDEGWLADAALASGAAAGERAAQLARRRPALALAA